DELAREPQQVQRPGPVRSDERTRGGEVLPGHDLRLLVGPVLGRAVPLPQPLEGGLEVALLLGGVARLPQLVPPWIPQHRHPVPERRLGVVAQPRGRLHDVGVGVVDDPPFRVGHAPSLSPRLPPAAPSIAPYDAPVIGGLLEEVGLPAAAAERVTLVGDERPYATPFAVVEAAASVLGAIGAAASLLHEEHGGPAQPVTVRRGHAGASLVGFAFQRLEEGETPGAPWNRDRPLVKLYECRDGRWM